MTEEAPVNTEGSQQNDDALINVATVAVAAAALTKDPRIAEVASVAIKHINTQSLLLKLAAKETQPLPEPPIQPQQQQVPTWQQQQTQPQVSPEVKQLAATLLQKLKAQ